MDTLIDFDVGTFGGLVIILLVMLGAFLLVIFIRSARAARNDVLGFQRMV